MSSRQAAQLLLIRLTTGLGLVSRITIEQILMTMLDQRMAELHAAFSLTQNQIAQALEISQQAVLSWGKGLTTDTDIDTF